MTGINLFFKLGLHEKVKQLEVEKKQIGVEGKKIILDNIFVFMLIWSVTFKFHIYKLIDRIFNELS